MRTYVLAGGAWLGGWCWQPVARRLRDNGYDAYPLTLTGLGGRVHLASTRVDIRPDGYAAWASDAPRLANGSPPGAPPHNTGAVR